ncbi:hypothetical protein BOX15_Mlig000327g1, partial [Macrostomum lignano]
AADADSPAAASARPVLLLSACCQSGRSDPAASLYPGLVGGLLGSPAGPPPALEAPSCDTGLPAGQCSAYSWRLSNKYYEAEVEILQVPEPLLGSQQLADAVEAVGLYFCPGQRRCFDVAKSWLAYLEHLEPEVRFLVTSDRSSNRSHGNNSAGLVTRDEAVGWCVSNGFELIELADERSNGVGEAGDSDGEDEDEDRCGLERMRQALHSHPWPNLVMRPDSERQESESMRRIREQLLAEQAAAAADTANSGEPEADAEASAEANLDKDEDAIVEPEAAAAAVASAISESAPNSASAAIVDEALLDRVYDDDEDGRRLESLFTRVMRAKAQADQLPVHSAERRELAANVIAGLWRELGMPEGELDGLEDSDEDD